MYKISILEFEVLLGLFLLQYIYHVVFALHELALLYHLFVSWQQLIHQFLETKEREREREREINIIKTKITNRISHKFNHYCINFIFLYHATTCVTNTQ